MGSTGMISTTFSAAESPHVDTTTRAPLRLNYDILFNVLYFVALESSASAADMMRTCRALYHEGAKVLLRRANWVSDLNITAYDFFVRAEGGARLPLVSTLSIYLSWENPFAAIVFANLLRDLPALTKVKVKFADRCRRKAPDAFRAILDLPALETLILLDATDAVLHMLSSLKPSVRSLAIQWDPCDSYGPVQPPPPAPSKGTCLPSVERIELRMSHTYIHARPWLEAFPNIKRLRINQTSWSRPEEEVRESNMAAIRAAHGWPSLTHVAGDLLIVYVLGFSHALTRLTLSLVDPSPLEMRMLGQVLGDTLPHALSLDFKIQYLDSPSDETHGSFLRGGGLLEPAFAAPGLSARLRELTLRIDLWGRCRAVEALTMDALTQMITALRLESLDITLGTECYLSAAELAASGVPHADVDVEGLASRCILDSQTLQSVDLTIEPCPSCNTNTRQAVSLAVAQTAPPSPGPGSV